MKHEVVGTALNHYVVVHRVFIESEGAAYEYLWNHHHFVHLYRVMEGSSKYRNVKVLGFREKIALIPIDYPNQDYPTLDDARLQAVAHCEANVGADGSMVRTHKGYGAWEQFG